MKNLKTKFFLASALIVATAPAWAKNKWLDVSFAAPTEFTSWVCSFFC